MFDVSFSELVLILVVGLIVFGPEKLPEVVRTAGLWIGKLRRSFNNIRAEIEREVGVDELRRDLHNQAIMDSLKGVQDDLRGAQQEIQRLPHEFQNTIAGSAANPVAHPVDNATETGGATPAVPVAPSAPATAGDVQTSDRQHHPS